MVKSARKTFLDDKAEENKNKPRELWKVFNNQLGCSQNLRTKSHNINIISDNTLITDKLEVANHFNTFFTTIASTLVTKLPPQSGKYGKEHINAYYNNLGVRKDDFKLAKVTTD